MRCIAANTTDVITLATDKPNTLRANITLRYNAACKPPRNTYSSRIG